MTETTETPAVETDDLTDDESPTEPDTDAA